MDIVLVVLVWNGYMIFDCDMGMWKFMNLLVYISWSVE